jgi:transcription elongation GreA/GreB family factor
MSVAFIREDSAEAAAEVVLPEKPVSQHPNWVTPSGLKQLQNAVEEAGSAFESHQPIADVNEPRRASALSARDLRYFTSRLSTAQLVKLPTIFEVVSFGHQVMFRRDDGRTQKFQIVGEDEAEPGRGTVSYVSPIAAAMLGKIVGDIVTLNDHVIEIIAIS